MARLLAAAAHRSAEAERARAENSGNTGLFESHLSRAAQLEALEHELEAMGAGRAGPPNARDFGSPTRPARLESYSKKYFGFADALPEIVRTDLDETRRLRTRADAEVS
jgi:hypothetical protein